jgi:hypothetical protein
MVFVIGCGEQNRSTTQPFWKKSANMSQTDEKNTQGKKEESSPIQSPMISYYEVRLIESPKEKKNFEKVWSVLEETSASGRAWDLYRRNGIRCGIGQMTDWPNVKKLLDSSEARVNGQMQVGIGSFTPADLLSDGVRAERTIFYYDQEGKMRGQDFGSSALVFSLAMAGRMPDNKIRLLLAPRIVRRKSGIENAAPAQRTRSVGFENQIEALCFVVDLGQDEFVLVGSAGDNQPETLVGSQLFSRFDRGQRYNRYILISPMAAVK